jgi:hypothetical protein
VLGLGAPARIRARTAALALVYLLASGAVLWGVAALILQHQGDAVELAAAYLFPESWRFAAREVVRRFFAAQSRDVLVNATIGASLIVVQLALFWLKELVSAAFEREARLTTTPPRELPLWQQAIEELELVVLFLAAQTSLVWLGYPPDPTRRTLAAALSYLFLFASFGIDFLSPLLQRHGLRYSTLLKTLVFGRPLTLLAFGAVFSLPAVGVARLAAAHPEWPLATRMALVFGTSLVAVVWGTLAGTSLAARFLDDAKRTKPPWAITRILFQAIVVGALAWNSYRLGAVALSLHHKSQILKLTYGVSWTSFGLDRPKLTDLLGDRLSVGVHFDLTIENPTAFVVEIEENRLEARHRGVLVASSRLSPVRIGPGQKLDTRVRLPLEVTPSALTAGTALLERKDWALTLFVEVGPGFELPIYLVTPVP